MLYSFLFISFFLRIISLGQSLWLDEAISALAVKNNSYWDLVTKFSLGDTHPPLYYLVLRFWSLIFGYSEISLRIPSVIFGVLTVYLIFKIAEFFQKKSLPTVAAILLATSPLHIYYSQEARMYAMTTFLATLAVYLFLLRKSWLLFSISVLLLGLTDYLPLLILVSFFLYLIKQKRDAKKCFMNFLMSLIPLFFFFLFWSKIFFKQVGNTAYYIEKNQWWQSILGRFSLKNLALVWVKFILGRISFEDDKIYFLVVLITSIIFSIPLLFAFFKRKNVNLVWYWLLIPFIIFSFSSLFVPGFSYFRILFVIPAFYLLISYGLLKIKNNLLWFALIILVNTSSSLLYLKNDKFWREDWSGLVYFIEQRIKEDEVVLISFEEPFAGYRWYSKRLELVKNFNQIDESDYNSFYSLDYLMDVTDPSRQNYTRLKGRGFQDVEVFNFRGVGQVRYWKKI